MIKLGSPTNNVSDKSNTLDKTHSEDNVSEENATLTALESLDPTKIKVKVIFEEDDSTEAPDDEELEEWLQNNEEFAIRDAVERETLELKELENDNEDKRSDSKTNIKLPVKSETVEEPKNTDEVSENSTNTQDKESITNNNNQTNENIECMSEEECVNTIDLIVDTNTNVTQEEASTESNEQVNESETSGNKEESLKRKKDLPTDGSDASVPESKRKRQNEDRNVDDVEQAPVRNDDSYEDNRLETIDLGSSDSDDESLASTRERLKKLDNKKKENTRKRVHIRRECPCKHDLTPELNSLSQECLSENETLLKCCKPAVVRIRARDRPRLVKRVKLPNIDEIRRINSKIATAQVVPINLQEQDDTSPQTLASRRRSCVAPALNRPTAEKRRLTVKNMINVAVKNKTAQMPMTAANKPMVRKKIMPVPMTHNKIVNIRIDQTATIITKSVNKDAPTLGDASPLTTLNQFTNIPTQNELHASTLEDVPPLTTLNQFTNIPTQNELHASTLEDVPPLTTLNQFTNIPTQNELHAPTLEKRNQPMARRKVTQVPMTQKITVNIPLEQIATIVYQSVNEDLIQYTNKPTQNELQAPTLEQCVLPLTTLNQFTNIRSQNKLQAPTLQKRNQPMARKKIIHARKKTVNVPIVNETVNEDWNQHTNIQTQNELHAPTLEEDEPPLTTLNQYTNIPTQAPTLEKCDKPMARKKMIQEPMTQKITVNIPIEKIATTVNQTVNEDLTQYTNIQTQNELQAPTLQKCNQPKVKNKIVQVPLTRKKTINIPIEQIASIGNQTVNEDLIQYTNIPTQNELQAPTFEKYNKPIARKTIIQAPMTRKKTVNVPIVNETVSEDWNQFANMPTQNELQAPTLVQCVPPLTTLNQYANMPTQNELQAPTLEKRYQPMARKTIIQAPMTRKKTINVPIVNETVNEDWNQYTNIQTQNELQAPTLEGDVPPLTTLNQYTNIPTQAPTLEKCNQPMARKTIIQAPMARKKTVDVPIVNETVNEDWNQYTDIPIQNELQAPTLEQCVSPSTTNKELDQEVLDRQDINVVPREDVAVVPGEDVMVESGEDVMVAPGEDVVDEPDEDVMIIPGEDEAVELGEDVMIVPEDDVVFVESEVVEVRDDVSAPLFRVISGDSSVGNAQVIIDGGTIDDSDEPDAVADYTIQANVSANVQRRSRVRPPPPAAPAAPAAPAPRQGILMVSQPAFLRVTSQPPTTSHVLLLRTPALAGHSPHGRTTVYQQTMVPLTQAVTRLVISKEKERARLQRERPAAPTEPSCVTVAPETPQCNTPAVPVPVALDAPSQIQARRTSSTQIAPAPPSNPSPRVQLVSTVQDANIVPPSKPFTREQPSSSAGYTEIAPAPIVTNPSTRVQHVTNVGTVDIVPPPATKSSTEVQSALKPEYTKIVPAPIKSNKRMHSVLNVQNADIVPPPASKTYTTVPPISVAEYTNIAPAPVNSSTSAQIVMNVDNANIVPPATSTNSSTKAQRVTNADTKVATAPIPSNAGVPFVTNVGNTNIVPPIASELFTQLTSNAANTETAMAPIPSSTGVQRANIVPPASKPTTKVQSVLKPEQRRKAPKTTKPSSKVPVYAECAKTPPAPKASEPTQAQSNQLYADTVPAPTRPDPPARDRTIASAEYAKIVAIACNVSPTQLPDTNPVVSPSGCRHAEEKKWEEPGSVNPPSRLGSLDPITSHRVASEASRTLIRLDSDAPLWTVAGEYLILTEAYPECSRPTYWTAEVPPLSRRIVFPRLADEDFNDSHRFVKTVEQLRAAIRAACTAEDAAALEEAIRGLTVPGSSSDCMEMRDSSPNRSLSSADTVASQTVIVSNKRLRGSIDKRVDPKPMIKVKSFANVNHLENEKQKSEKSGGTTRVQAEKPGQKENNWKKATKCSSLGSGFKWPSVLLHCNRYLRKIRDQPLQYGLVLSAVTSTEQCDDLLHSRSPLYAFRRRDASLLPLPPPSPPTYVFAQSSASSRQPPAQSSI